VDFTPEFYIVASRAKLSSPDSDTRGGSRLEPLLLGNPAEEPGQDGALAIVERRRRDRLVLARTGDLGQPVGALAVSVQA